MMVGLGKYIAEPLMTLVQFCVSALDGRVCGGRRGSRKLCNVVHGGHAKVLVACRSTAWRLVKEAENGGKSSLAVPVIH